MKKMQNQYSFQNRVHDNMELLLLKTLLVWFHYGPNFLLDVQFYTFHLYLDSLRQYLSTPKQVLQAFLCHTLEMGSYSPDNENVCF